MAPVLAASVVAVANDVAVTRPDFRSTPEADISLHRGIRRKG